MAPLEMLFCAADGSPTRTDRTATEMRALFMHLRTYRREF
jgi:hypothetical protein